MVDDTFCLDTNIVVALNRNTPRDVYPGPWEALEELVASGRACMPQDVLLELDRSDDECADWAKGMPNFIRQPTAREITLVAEITDAYEGWVSERQNAADPWVIAHAVVHADVVVTNERRKGPGTANHNLKIPNVADDYGLECITFLDLARREGWRFGAV